MFCCPASPKIVAPKQFQHGFVFLRYCNPQGKKVVFFVLIFLRPLISIFLLELFRSFNWALFVLDCIFQLYWHTSVHFQRKIEIIEQVLHNFDSFHGNGSQEWIQRFHIFTGQFNPRMVRLFRRFLLWSLLGVLCVNYQLHVRHFNPEIFVNVAHSKFTQLGQKREFDSKGMNCGQIIRFYKPKDLRNLKKLSLGS